MNIVHRSQLSWHETFMKHQKKIAESKNCVENCKETQENCNYKDERETCEKIPKLFN